MANKNHEIYLEIGEKKLFAAAVAWPGWCRHGRDEASALQALLAYGPRYARLLEGTALAFAAPEDVADFDIIERVPGTMTTDFGAPDQQIARDDAPFTADDLVRTKLLLDAYWDGLAAAVETAVGHKLRKGPRGGGREVEGIVDHVIGAQESYLRTLGWKFKQEKGADQAQKMAYLRTEMIEGLKASAAGELPETGPRGGKRWPPHYFVRRSAWHIIDHIWEIEDRLEKPDEQR